jgi:hypothetical protein
MNITVLHFLLVPNIWVKTIVFIPFMCRFISNVSLQTTDSKPLPDVLSGQIVTQAKRGGGWKLRSQQINLRPRKFKLSLIKGIDMAN